MRTQKDEKEVEYGKWHDYTPEDTFAELNPLPPVLGDIWPHWNDGIPEKLRRQLGSPVFFRGKVKHNYRVYRQTLTFKWSPPFKLPDLRENTYLLPNNAGGVYPLSSATRQTARGHSRAPECVLQSHV